MLSSADFRQAAAVQVASAVAGDGIFQAAWQDRCCSTRNGRPIAGIRRGLRRDPDPVLVIGPFAGALLDRWDRRKAAGHRPPGADRGWWCFAAAAEGFGLRQRPAVHRRAARDGRQQGSIGSGLSASLPHVVEQRDLVGGNSIVATLGLPRRRSRSLRVRAAAKCSARQRRIPRWSPRWRSSAR